MIYPLLIQYSKIKQLDRVIRSSTNIHQIVPRPKEALPRHNPFNSLLPPPFNPTSILPLPNIAFEPALVAFPWNKIARRCCSPGLSPVAEAVGDRGRRGGGGGSIGGAHGRREPRPCHSHGPENFSFVHRWLLLLMLLLLAVVVSVERPRKNATLRPPSCPSPSPRCMDLHDFNWEQFEANAPSTVSCCFSRRNDTGNGSDTRPEIGVFLVWER